MYKIKEEMILVNCYFFIFFFFEFHIAIILIYWGISSTSEKKTFISEHDVLILLMFSQLVAGTVHLR